MIRATLSVEEGQARELSVSHKNRILASPEGSAVVRERMTPASYALSYSSKGHPVCVEETLMEEAMSSGDLSKLCFSRKRQLQIIHPPSPHPPRSKISRTSNGTNTLSSSGSGGCLFPPSVVSCTSFSSCTKPDSVNHNYVSEFSDAESLVGHKLSFDPMLQHQHPIKAPFSSDDVQAKILSKSTSRQGRKGQRWRTDAFPPYHTNRLVTGCIPIVKGGKILLVSATKKKEWIFPKGGWDVDESMEECAMRESFEEAGVCGSLGPRLTEVHHETRKARKRRMEFEEVMARYTLSNKKEKSISNNIKMDTSTGKRIFLIDQKKEELNPNFLTTIASSATLAPLHQADHNISNTITEDSNSKAIRKQSEASGISNDNEPDSNGAVAMTLLRDKELENIREKHRKIENKQKCDEELSSIASWDTTSSGNYTHVRMTLFPLYVSEVKTQWPESGRCRKAVPIDEAIKMLETRPELQQALKEVKEKGLHLVLPEKDTDC